MLFTFTPLYAVPEDTLARQTALDIITARYPATLDNLRELLKHSRNDPRAPTPSKYLCLGCQVGMGDERRRMLAFTTYPLYTLAAQQLLQHQFMLYTYHAQAYEDGADPGPGGVVGIRPTSGRVLMPELDSSASSALKMWLWLNKETDFAYEDETQASHHLWQLATERCAAGLAFLRSRNNAPEFPVPYPPEVAHDLHTLLGVTALRRLVALHLGLRLVLVDDTRLIGEDHLQWSHFPT